MSVWLLAVRMVEVASGAFQEMLHVPGAAMMSREEEAEMEQSTRKTGPFHLQEMIGWKGQFLVDDSSLFGYHTSSDRMPCSSRMLCLNRTSHTSKGLWKIGHHARIEHDTMHTKSMDRILVSL